MEGLFMLTLMYHRVSVPDSNPWGVCVSPQHFEAQIAWITKRYRVIDPATLSQELMDRRVDNDSILISFDDGYQDNFTTARPILEKYRCPATFFIPAGFIGRPEPFWWDELEFIFLHAEKLPSTLRLQIGTTDHLFRLNPERVAPGAPWKTGWRWYEEAPSDRCTIFLHVWALLRPLAGEEIQAQMQRLRRWAGDAPYAGAARPVMTGAELMKLAAGSLFTVGLHTRSHPELQGKDAALQHQEISEGQCILKDRFAIDSDVFAYPYGRYDSVTIDRVKKLNLSLAFTTNQTSITNDSDPLLLGRIQPPDSEDMRILDTGN